MTLPHKEKRVTRILSFGGGVQTSYLLLKHYERYDAVIFADVGAGDREHAEEKITYFILDTIIEPFCRRMNIPLLIKHDGESLWDYSMRKKVIPVRFPRWCTDKKKKRVIRKALKELGAERPTKKNPKGNIILQDIGFTVDEAHRFKPDLEEPQYVKSEYPLLDMKITRQECVDWLNKNYPFIFKIKINNNEIVLDDWKYAKSGCWFCMFTKKENVDNYSDWQKQEVIKLEKNNPRYPEMILRNKPMEEIFKKKDMSLDEFESCDEGYCFV